jgi:predicted methyltransferase
MKCSATILAVIVLCGFALPASAADDDAKLRALVANPARAESNRIRDPYRHPLETLTFFGVREDMKVVEIWPGGGGWWTEILAPYLKDRGTYYAAQPDDTMSEESRTGRANFVKNFGAGQAVYTKIVTTEFNGNKHDIAPAGSADMVLTFRNLHNWLTQGTADDAFRAFYRALKPGGVLGIEDHRARTDVPAEQQLEKGYVREDVAIALAEKAGFRLLARSEVNANAKDTKDYASGVWTLPPTYRLKDQDRAKYQAIGESDRFTLKFMKP